MDFIIKQGRSTLDSYIHDRVVLEPENHYFVGHFCSQSKKMHCSEVE